VSEPEPNGAPSAAARSATKLYRTTPLRALQLHPPYFHNGIASTLEAVVELYDTRQGLNLTAQQKDDLVQYLKSLRPATKPATPTASPVAACLVF
jgi:cytochrome c peroxidase